MLFNGTDVHVHCRIKHVRLFTKQIKISHTQILSRPVSAVKISIQDFKGRLQRHSGPLVHILEEGFNMNHPQTELILSHIFMAQAWILGFMNGWRERKTQVSQEKDPLKKLPQSVEALQNDCDIPYPEAQLCT